MIPKIIHYCWFGRNPKPSLFQKCIRSWKKNCPDYEIIEWNEDNFNISINPYVKEAYEAQKWAFVTDYARLWIVYNYGGVYLDTDVEIVKSFDELLNDTAFFGFEDDDYIATGLGFGAEKGNVVIEKMLRDYDSEHFIFGDGTYNLVTCPVRNTNSIRDLLPVKIEKDKVINIYGATLYPPEYFCPLSADGSQITVTENTYSIHWFTASWLSSDEKIVHKYRIFRGKCERILGKRLGGYFARFVYLFQPQKREVLKRM